MGVVDKVYLIKKEYNKLLRRAKQAEYYLNNVQAPEEKLNKWIKAFQEITVVLSFLMQRFKVAAGREMTEDEILNGFKDVMQ